MQILFNKTLEQCRQLGARGGRAFARNQRLRKSQTTIPPVAPLPTPPRGRACLGQEGPVARLSYENLRWCLLTGSAWLP